MDAGGPKLFLPLRSGSELSFHAAPLQEWGLGEALSRVLASAAGSGSEK